jgi:hypothetical protein
MKIAYKLIKPTAIFIVVVLIYAGICYSLLNQERHWAGIDFSEEESNDSVDRFYEYLYFASTTYSTAGYGDIYPKSIYSRGLTLLVQLSMIIGLTSLI